jgi:hypothetical protein
MQPQSKNHSRPQLEMRMLQISEQHFPKDISVSQLQEAILRDWLRDASEVVRYPLRFCGFLPGIQCEGGRRILPVLLWMNRWGSTIGLPVDTNLTVARIVEHTRESDSRFSKGSAFQIQGFRHD